MATSKKTASKGKEDVKFSASELEDLRIRKDNGEDLSDDELAALDSTEAIVGATDEEVAEATKRFHDAPIGEDHVAGLQSNPSGRESNFGMERNVPATPTKIGDVDPRTGKTVVDTSGIDALLRASVTSEDVANVFAGNTAGNTKGLDFSLAEIEQALGLRRSLVGDLKARQYRLDDEINALEALRRSRS